MSTPDNALVVQVPRTTHRVDEARERLAEARTRTRGSLTALRDELKVRVDWREWYQAHPGAFLAAAFLFGFWIADRRR